MRFALLVAVLCGCSLLFDWPYTTGDGGSPDVLDVPDVLDIPDVARVDSSTVLPDLASPSDVLDVPDVLDIPDVARVDSSTVLPDLASPSDVLDVPDVLDIPDVARVDSSTVLPDLASPSDVLDVPDVMPVLLPLDPGTLTPGTSVLAGLGVGPVSALYLRLVVASNGLTCPSVTLGVAVDGVMWSGVLVVTPDTLVATGYGSVPRVSAGRCTLSYPAADLCGPVTFSDASSVVVTP